MSYDPLPPVDSVSSYSRPSRNAGNNTAASQLEGGLLSSFFRSLMPGFNPDEVVVNQPQRPAVDPDDDLAAAAEGAGANLQRSVGALVTAMRDLLSSIHLPDLRNEIADNEEGESDDDDDQMFD